MLSRSDCASLAKEYLIKFEHPIDGEGTVILAEDENDLESKNFLADHNLARVWFNSNDPNNEFIPSVFIVYVNLETGEVHMPRHMV